MEDTEPSQQPLSASVRKVFDEFLLKLEADPLVGKSVAARLKSGLLEGRKMDADSLRQILFVADTTTP